MKRFFTLFVAVLAWAAMSCSDKESSEPRLDPPFQTVFVSDTGDNGALLYGRYDGASVGQVKAAGPPEARRAMWPPRATSGTRHTWCCSSTV